MSFEMPDLEPTPKSKKLMSKEIKEFTKISISGLEAFDTKRDLSFMPDCVPVQTTLLPFDEKLANSTMVQGP